MPRKTFYGKRYHGRKVRRIQRAWRRHRRRRRPTLRKKVNKLMREYRSNEGFIDYYNSFSVDYSYGAVGPQLFTLAQGDDYNEREGNQVIGKYLLLKGSIYITATDPLIDDKFNRVRLLLVSYSRKDSAGINQVVQYDSGTLLQPALAIDTFKKRNTTNKYKILFDKTYHVTQENPVRTVSETIKIPKSCNMMKYTSAVSQEPQINATWFYVASDSRIPNHPVFEFNLRQVFQK